MTGYDDFECFTVTFTQHFEGFRILLQALNFEANVFWSTMTRASLIDPPELPLRPIFAVETPNPDGDAFTFQVNYMRYSRI